MTIGLCPQCSFSVFHYIVNLRYSALETGLSGRHLWNLIRIQWFLVAPTKIVPFKWVYCNTWGIFLAKINTWSFTSAYDHSFVECCWFSRAFIFSYHGTGHKLRRSRNKHITSKGALTSSTLINLVSNNCITVQIATNDPSTSAIVITLTRISLRDFHFCTS